MEKTITRLFDNIADARGVIRELEAMGFTFDQISVVSGHVDDAAAHARRLAKTATVGDAGANAGQGEVGGGQAGQTSGILKGLDLVTIPDVGPVVAAGRLAAADAASGLVGALVQAGDDERDARVYAEGVRRGGALVSVRAQAPYQDQVRAVMLRLGGVDAATREPM